MHHNLIAAVAICLATPVVAEIVPADCTNLVAPLQAIEGYQFSASPAAPLGGWCVFDGASLRAKAADRPTVSFDRLRLQGSMDDGDLVGLTVELAGLRVLPKAGDRQMDDRLRALFRLQTASVSGSAQVNRQVGQLEIRNLSVVLKDGMEIGLDADIQGAGLDLVSLIAGSLTRLELDWRNDGRFLRPLMEIAGERIDPATTGTAAVDTARAALVDLASAIPASIFAEDAQDELERLVAALPQGRGRLRLSLQSAGGIGVARVALVALADDPFGPEALGRLLAGSQLSLDWQPGLAP